jgi:translation initiation factor IF-1
MPESDRIQMNGTVTGPIDQAVFRVQLSNGRQVPARLSGKMRLEFIRVLPGTEVLVEFSPYDLSQGRIIGLV